MGLKEYPRHNKKHAFYLWYLRSTDTGGSILQKVADQLVLYTNINKTTAFYRLFKKVKGKKRIVSPKTKRMTIMIYLYSRLFFERQKQEFFEKFKIYANKNSKINDLASKLIERSKMRKRECLHIWIRKLNDWKKKMEAAKILQETLRQKMKYIVQYWR